jgi:hypothetical protein
LERSDWVAKNERDGVQVIQPPEWNARHVLVLRHDSQQQKGEALNDVIELVSHHPTQVDTDRYTGLGATVRQNAAWWALWEKEITVLRAAGWEVKTPALFNGIDGPVEFVKEKHEGGDYHSTGEMARDNDGKITVWLHDHTSGLRSYDVPTEVRPKLLEKMSELGLKAGRWNIGMSFETFDAKALKKFIHALAEKDAFKDRLVAEHERKSFCQLAYENKALISLLKSINEGRPLVWNSSPSPWSQMGIRRDTTSRTPQNTPAREATQGFLEKVWEGNVPGHRKATSTKIRIWMIGPAGRALLDGDIASADTLLVEAKNKLLQGNAIKYGDLNETLVKLSETARPTPECVQDLKTKLTMLASERKKFRENKLSASDLGVVVVGIMEGLVEYDVVTGQMNVLDEHLTQTAPTYSA